MYPVKSRKGSDGVPRPCIYNRHWVFITRTRTRYHELNCVVSQYFINDVTERGGGGGGRTAGKDPLIV